MSTDPIVSIDNRIGESTDHDQMLFEETDEAFYMGIAQTCSRNYVFMNLSANSTSEVHLIDAHNDESEPFVTFPRARLIEYSVEDRDGDLYVLTNDNAVNFRLMRTPVENIDNTNWETVVDHSEDTTLTGFVMFKDYIAVAERHEGLPAVRIIDSSENQYRIEKPAEVQELRIGDNREYDTQTCRLNANSLILPFSHYDCEMNSGHLTHVKTKPVGGHYNPSDYDIERHLATSHDGTSVPVYLVSKKDTAKSRPGPLLLYAYGAYGVSVPLHFSSARLSLLNRGITYAVAHIRGGGEFGRKWYLDGKMENKKNTFLDFNACADYLIDEGITSPDQLAIEGGSAGGLVVGNYLMSRSGRCRAALAHVPFVDVITTMLDKTLPLTVTEWDEWGNPYLSEDYDYMKSYSPYDNVKKGEYPALYISGGLNDTRVGYWEPAKWAAKIRRKKRDSNLLVLRTEMHSGHGGKSGRDAALREISIERAFVIFHLTTVDSRLDVNLL